jgi:MFS transporter, ACS family, allantoate permease
MGRASETSDEKAAIDTHVFVAVEDVDTAAELASGEQGELDPVEALRVRFVALSSLVFGL